MSCDFGTARGVNRKLKIENKRSGTAWLSPAPGMH
jgi:hypothetical protein